jgi:hypothetical protein
VQAGPGWDEDFGVRLAGRGWMRWGHVGGAGRGPSSMWELCGSTGLWLAGEMPSAREGLGISVDDRT